MPSHIIVPHGPNHDGFDSSESGEEFGFDDADFESHGLTTDSYVHRQPSSWIRSLLSLLLLRPRALLNQNAHRQDAKQLSRRRHRYQRFFGRRIRLLFNSLAALACALVLLTAIFWPSYNNPPAHYGALRKRILASDDHGRANVNNQKIFIAASIYDKGGHLVNGVWGRNVLELLDLLGHRNVFLSIYENDSGLEAEDALKFFGRGVQCNSSLVYEEHLPTEDIPMVTLPDGSKRIKRIAYLAEVRNRALQPLDERSDVTYDKVLFLNDVVFDPIDAVQLLFSTNANEIGEASYNAACAVDFINPFKFYDTFATRDLEGYSMGVPFFPWYSNAGQGLSRQDVLGGKDAVRVKSCWGGMVAFDAKFFQASRTPSHDGQFDSGIERASNRNLGLFEPVRFRAVPDLDWDASECCLVHADILSASANMALEDDAGIYQNPYVRVAYGPWTLWWLPITRRFERLYTVPHTLINRLVGLPWYNPRRMESKEGDTQGIVQVSESVSIAKTVSVGGDGYCGMRTLQLQRESLRMGDKNWETVPIPLG